MSRQDFFRCIQTLEATNVNVSAGELDGPGPDNCLLQVGPPGDYTCAYLNDSQVRNLIAALRAFLKVTILLLLCAVGTMAQTVLLDAPIAKEQSVHRVIDRKFLTVFAILGTAKTADAITTERFLSRGCRELNPIFGGPRPSAGRVAITNAGYFAGEVTMAYFIKRIGRRSRWLQHLWLIEPSLSVAEHIQAGAHNEALHCP